MPGLPKVMQEKREALKIKLGTAAPPATEPPQPVVLGHMDTPQQPDAPQATEGGDPSSTPSQEPAPAPSMEEQWRITAEKWEQKFRSLEGIVQGLEPKYKGAQEQVEKLEKELKALREAVPPPPPDTSDDWTPEEEETYGSSRAVIEKAARKIAKGELKAATKLIEDLRAEIGELRQQTGRVQQDLTQTTEQQFYKLVVDNVPNFEKIIALNEWRSYLDEKPRYSRQTFGQLLQEAHNARDLDSIKDIFKGFKPSKSVLATMANPPLNGGSVPVNDRPATKPTLKWSDRQALSKALRFGKVKSTDPEYIRLEREFKEAEREGRINYDA